MVNETTPATPDVKATLEMPIEELGLSSRTRNLLGEGFGSVGDLLTKTPGDLLRLPNFGKQAVREIENALRKHGLGLKKS